MFLSVLATGYRLSYAGHKDLRCVARPQTIIDSSWTMDPNTTLAVVPSLTARAVPNGGVVLTKKFINGMRKYVEYWDGPVAAFMEPAHVPTSNLDEIEINPAKLPFTLKIVRFDDPNFGQLLAKHRLVLGSVSHRQNHLEALCRSSGLPCVYVAEFSLKTRLQVIRSEVTNPVISLRRQFWDFNQERRQRRAIRLSSGIQCNGTPTFEAYRLINPSPLLFFDTRVSEDMLVADSELTERAKALTQGSPLRLMFSGRLIAMKGADELVLVAAELRRLGVSFDMMICGGGVLEPKIRADIERHGLSECIKLTGILEFEKELVPLTKKWTDLFVCCHRTGDPSGTYLDVMGCGVPIVGYDNEAFRGMIRESSAGWLVPMNQPKQVAEKIAELNKDRAMLLDASKRAIEFARLHTFERTFKARIEHMKSCSAPTKPRPVA
jgi:colanic acid/amylovoran biosynthesis glycosyltransferase